MPDCESGILQAHITHDLQFSVSYTEFLDLLHNSFGFFIPHIISNYWRFLAPLLSLSMPRTCNSPPGTQERLSSVAERLRSQICNQKIAGSNPASGHLATPFRKKI